MKKFAWTILVFALHTTFVEGQADASIEHEFSLLRSAGEFYCHGDTLKAINLLENYTTKFPDNVTTMLLSKRLAEFYFQMNKIDQAILILRKALDQKQKGGAVFSRDSCGLFKGLEISSIKAEICVLLSNIYVSLGNKSEALNYLELADTKYLPSFGGCGNGMMMYKTKLSLDIADYYLLVGDTSKSIDRLLDFFLSDEAYNRLVTEKLKYVLLTQYSQWQISEEINYAIENLEIVKAGKDGSAKLLKFIFFGRTIWKSAYRDLDFYKNYYPTHRNILTLISG